MDSLELKQAHAGLTGIILEGGKLNAEPILMRGVLSDYKRELIAVLSTTGFNFPHIIDVNWRLTFHMKSQSIDKENSPIYLLRFDTTKPSPTPLNNKDYETNESVEFACNSWELLDLVQKLKDATKQFDRVCG